MADRTVSIDFVARVAAFTSGVQKMRTEVRTMRGEVSKASRDNAAEMQTVGVAATAMGVGIVGGLAASAKAAMDFESSFAGVRKTVDASEAEFAALSDGFRGLSREIPISVNELNGIGESAGQLGIAKENILDFSATMADLGVATNLTAEDAATSFARFANITQMPQDQFDRLGSTVVDLGNNLATTESEIAEFGLRLAGAGAQVGMTEAEILGLGGALSSVGINAEAGGTAISKVMIEMAQAVSAGGEQLGMFAETAGVSAQEFAQAFQDDPAAAIASFIEGLGRIDETGGDLFATLEELGITEQRMRDAMLRTAGAGTLVADSMRLANDAFEENTALTDEAAQRYGTLESRLTLAKNAVYDAAISVGQTLTPALGFAADAATGLAGGIADLPGPAAGVIAGVGGLAGAASLAAGGFLIAAPRIVATKDALGELAKTMPRSVGALRGMATFMTGPWGLAMGGAVAAIGLYASEKGKQRQRIEEVIATLDAETGALTENSDEWIANALAESGALDHSETLGLSKGDLTLALQGEAAALDRVNEAINEHIGGVGPAADAAFRLTGLMRDQTHELAAGQEAWRARNEELAESQGRFIDVAHAVDSGMTNSMYNLEAAHGAQTDAAEDGTGATDEFGNAVGEAGTAADDTRTQLEKLTDALDAIVRVNLNAEDAAIRVRDGFRDLTETFKENGATLEENTAKGDANRKAVIDQSRAILDEVAARHEQGDSLTDIAIGYDEQVGKLREVMAQAGLTEGEIDSYIETLGLTPEQVLTTILAEDDATNIIGNVIRELGRIPTLTTTEIRTNRTYTGSAGGNTYQHDGGWAGTGPMRDGPLKPDEVPTVLQTGEFVLSREMIARMGGVPRFHNGGMVGGPFDSGLIGSMVTGVMNRPLSEYEQTLRRVEGLVESWEQAVREQDQARTRAGLTDSIRDAQKAVGDAEDADERKRATDDLADARQRLADHDRDAARAAEESAIATQRALLEERHRRVANRDAYEFDRMSATEQVARLDERIGAERRYTDEWIRLTEERTSILERESDAAATAFETGLDDLDRMLDEQDRIGEQMAASEADYAKKTADARSSYAKHTADAEADYLGQVADAERRYANDVAASRRRVRDAIAQTIRARAGELRQSIDVGDDLYDWQASSIAEQLDREVADLTDWADSLGQLRAAGVDDDVISMLGLDTGPEALGQVRELLRAGQEDIARLNESAAAREVAISQQVADERVDGASQLYRSLAEIEADGAEELAELRTDHHAELAEMETVHEDARRDARREHLDRLSEMEREFHDEQEQLGEELAAIGADNGRGYSDAIAAGIAAGIPAIEAQVAEVKRLMRQMKSAEAAWTDDTNSVAATRYRLGLEHDAVSDRIWADRLADGTADMAEVERRLGIKADTFDSGGILTPGLTLAYNGTGRDERVMTGAQMAGMAASSSTTQTSHTYNVTVPVTQSAMDPGEFQRVIRRVEMVHGG